MPAPYLYRATVTYVVEGGRYDAVIDLGFFSTLRAPVELRGVELPLFRTHSPQERALARAAKDLAMHVLLGKWLLIQTFKESHQPQHWPAQIYLDAEVPSGREDLLVEVNGTKMVDFTAYMNACKDSGFNLKAIPLTHAERAKRGRKALSRGH